jgi:osmoprotectant transport system ATP-binding protein
MHQKIIKTISLHAAFSVHFAMMVCTHSGDRSRAGNLPNGKGLRLEGSSNSMKTMSTQSLVPHNATIQFDKVTYGVNGTPAQANISSGQMAIRVPDRRPVLVANITLNIAAGETVVLLGRSGSGKTTLLRLINRMLVPTAGKVLVQGRATTEWNPYKLRRSIGYVIQEAGLFPHFTVAENIALVPTLEKWGAQKISARLAELLKLVGLDSGDFASRYPRQLSGGQRQRVGVARALAADPQILLMDEPFGALDPVTRGELQREFAALAKRLGKTIVFVTHDLREALLLASRIVMLQDGKIVAVESPDDFLKHEHPEVQAFAESLGQDLGTGPTGLAGSTAGKRG